MQNLIRRRVLWRLIWVCTVWKCHSPSFTDDTLYTSLWQRSNKKSATGTILLLTSNWFGILKKKNLKKGARSRCCIQCKVNKTALTCLFQASEDSWRRRFPDSKIFCRELFGCVECYKESVGHSSLLCWIRGVFAMWHGGQFRVLSKWWRGHENSKICWSVSFKKLKQKQK